MFQVNNHEEGSVIDLGAARHIHPDVVVKDSDNLHRLASFTGETSWTQENGCIPITLRYDQDTEVDLDIQDADFKKDVNAPLLSICANCCEMDGNLSWNGTNFIHTHPMGIWWSYV